VGHFTDHLAFLTPSQRKLILGEAIAKFFGWPGADVLAS